MTTRKKRRLSSDSTIAARRRHAQAYQKRRDELMEQTLLGMDDGTPEAAMNEELSFDKFMDDIINEEVTQVERQRQLHEADEPWQMAHQRRHRERDSNQKITYKK